MLPLVISVHNKCHIIFNLLLTSYLKHDLDKKKTITIPLYLIYLCVQRFCAILLFNIREVWNDMAILTNFLFWQGAGQYWNCI